MDAMESANLGERLNGVADDIRFFYREADGAMGVCSAWNVPENPYEPIRRPQELNCGPIYVRAPHRAARTYELHGLWAARRHRRIAWALALLDQRTVAILRGAYADDRPSLVREVFGELAGLAEATPTAAAAYKRAESTMPLTAWLDSLCQRCSYARRHAKRPQARDWAVVEQIRVDATRALTRAEGEYLRAKGVIRGI